MYFWECNFENSFHVGLISIMSFLREQFLKYFFFLREQFSKRIFKASSFENVFWKFNWCYFKEQFDNVFFEKMYILKCIFQGSSFENVLKIKFKKIKWNKKKLIKKIKKICKEKNKKLKDNPWKKNFKNVEKFWKEIWK